MGYFNSHVNYNSRLNFDRITNKSRVNKDYLRFNITSETETEGIDECHLLMSETLDSEILRNLCDSVSFNLIANDELLEEFITSVKQVAAILKYRNDADKFFTSDKWIESYIKKRFTNFENMFYIEVLNKFKKTKYEKIFFIICNINKTKICYIHEDDIILKFDHPPRTKTTVNKNFLAEGKQIRHRSKYFEYVKSFIEGFEVKNKEEKLKELKKIEDSVIVK